MALDINVNVQNFRENYMAEESGIFVFDLETTGLPLQPSEWNYYPYTYLEKYDVSRIVSIAWEVYNMMGQKISECFKIVKTTQPNTDEASKIHGITLERMEKDGIDLAEIIPMLFEDLKRCTVVVAHNIPFHATVLSSEMHRGGYNNIVEELQKKFLYCTMTHGREKMRPKKFPTLEELHVTLFNRKGRSTDVHQTNEDASITARIFFKMVPKKKVHVTGYKAEEYTTRSIPSKYGLRTKMKKTQTYMQDVEIADPTAAKIRKPRKRTVSHRDDYPSTDEY